MEKVPTHNKKKKRATKKTKNGEGIDSKSKRNASKINRSPSNQLKLDQFFTIKKKQVPDSLQGIQKPKAEIEVVEMENKMNVIDCIDLCSDDENYSKKHKIEDENNNKFDKNKQTNSSRQMTRLPSSSSTSSLSSNNHVTSFGRKRKQCPTYKCIEGTSFAVDAFNYGRIDGVKHYFLTHFHADHYVGLTSKFDMPIYMSKITANLVREFIPVAEKYVHVLSMDYSIIQESVEIIAIDANHCPGAIMLIFKFPTGRCILHTGDFRACPEMESYPEFWNNDIHTIYLDTTYLRTAYSFCTQTESIDQAISNIREFKKKHENKRILYICGTYVIGKEKFWTAIARMFDLRVWAEGNRKKALNVMKLEALENRLCENPLDAQMHILPIVKVNYASLCEYFQPPLSDHFDTVLAMRPSGWEKSTRPQFRGKINIVGIEYSEHSSYNELKRFVSYIKPTKVISTVPSGRDPSVTDDVPSSWYQYKTLTPHCNFQPSISSFMKIIPQETKQPNLKEKPKFVNISPVKTKKSSTKGKRDICSPTNDLEAKETIHECVAAQHYIPPLNAAATPNPVKRLATSLKVRNFSCYDDADSDWLS